MRPPDWSNIHEQREFNRATLALAPLSFLYGLGVRLRLASDKMSKKKELPGFVVSIGNLTAGGTGKTPAALMVAEWALEEGYNVAVLSRGYMGGYKTKVFVVSDKDDIKAGPDMAGDEPCLLARRLRGAPVIISKNRYLAGLTARDRFGSNFFVLDDGFQHLALKRNLDLVLINASNPFGNGHLLPWGPLREPVKQLRRADAFIMTRSGRTSTGHGDPGRILKEQLQAKPLFAGDHVPEKIVFPFENSSQNPEALKGKRVIAFAGIARPEAFKDTLTSLGANPVYFRGFRDHHSFSSADLSDLMAKKEDTGADYLITTEKDWVKLENLVTEKCDLAYLAVKFVLLSGREQFFNMVKERADKVLGG